MANTSHIDVLNSSDRHKAWERLVSISQSPNQSAAGQFDGWPAEGSGGSGFEHAWPGVDFMIGAIFAWGGPAIPANCLTCDGSAISRGIYSGLFALYGTTWGAGDGSTTFNLPDLRERTVYGVGTKAEVNALGDTDGNALGSRGVGPMLQMNSGVQAAGTGATGSGVAANGIAQPGFGAAYWVIQVLP